MYKSGHGYFWIGGPGEEAFNVPLGLLIKKGQGPAFDYLHFHYRQSATLLAMGEEPLGSLRQMKNTATDPYSGGRNFAGHFSQARVERGPGHLAHRGAVRDGRRHGARAEAPRRRRHHHRHRRRRGHGRGRLRQLPRLVQPAGPRAAGADLRHQQPLGHLDAYRRSQGVERISDRGVAFGMRSKTIDGNDPISAYLELKEAFEYVRTERKPYLVEANVSRLYGHSSASGANFTTRRARLHHALRGAARARTACCRRPRPTQCTSATRDQMAELARQAKEEPQPEGQDDLGARLLR